MGADQRQRELARQHFIIGEPRPRLAFGREIRRCGRPVQGRQRRGKIRPLLARRVGRIEPLRQHRNGGERRRDGPPQRVLREPLGERIERLDQRHAGELGGIDHALGMHHLQHAVIGFDGAGDIAQLPQRQHPFDLLLAQREIRDRQRAGVVRGVDLERRARPVRRRRPIAFGRDRDRHGAAGHDIAQLQLQAAIDRAGRHVEHEIEHARAVRAADEAGIQPLGLAGDAGKRRDGGEQRVEQGRAHGGRYCAGSGAESRAETAPPPLRLRPRHACAIVKPPDRSDVLRVRAAEPSRKPDRAAAATSSCNRASSIWPRSPCLCVSVRLRFQDLRNFVVRPILLKSGTRR